MDTVLGLVIIAILSAITLVPFVRIFQKAGRTGWWAALMLIPIINIVVLWVFAFSHWPALDRNSS
jgi:predicted PurR-regulated permease PerM